ncbi:MAG: methyltransferase domain-containing protein [Proteobacteria bacterium]|nr:methyltransferase domain-containing protein [Pseudomonadota bacterium]
MAAEDRLYDDAALARFYDLDNGWTADRDFCLGLANGCRSVLDLGGGTGALTLRIAREAGASLVGVDPAGAMLDLARARPGAGKLRWVQADARGWRR